MKRLIPTLKTALKEPKVYALVLHAPQGSILHLGIHHSLEEAVKEATPALLEGDPALEENSSIEMWTSLEGADIIKTMISFEPSKFDFPEGVSLKKPEGIKKAMSTKDYIVHFKTMKNDLMNVLIKDGNLTDIKTIGTLLNSSEKKLIISGITKRKKLNEKK